MEEYGLTIAAFPLTAFVFMVTKGDDAQEVESVRTFFPDMLTTVSTLREKFAFDTITLYGPKVYVDHLKEPLERNFKDCKVTLAYAGDGE